MSMQDLRFEAEKSAEFAARFHEQDHYAAKLGYKPVRVGKGEAEYEITIDASFHNPPGTLHGGLLFSIMDSSQGAAVFSILSNEPGKNAATAKAEMRYKKPVISGKLRVISKCEPMKKSLLPVNSLAYNEAGEVVAEMQAVWFVQ
jgi:acyl-CoA thioesterase